MVALLSFPGVDCVLAENTNIQFVRPLVCKQFTSYEVKGFLEEEQGMGNLKSLLVSKGLPRGKPGEVGYLPMRLELQFLPLSVYTKYHIYKLVTVPGTNIFNNS